MKKTTTGYSYDAITNTLTLTADFVKKRTANDKPQAQDVDFSFHMLTSQRSGAS